MMEKYIDTNGDIAYCYQLIGPTILNTVQGETCGSVDEWVLMLENGSCAILENNNFNVSFKKIEE